VNRSDCSLSVSFIAGFCVCFAAISLWSVRSSIGQTLPNETTNDGLSASHFINAQSDAIAMPEIKLRSVAQTGHCQSIGAGVNAPRLRRAMRKINSRTSKVRGRPEIPLWRQRGVLPLTFELTY
jgi:hypothetical protein